MGALSRGTRPYPRDLVVAKDGAGRLYYRVGMRSAWYEHQNLRDERVEAFTTLLWEGGP